MNLSFLAALATSLMLTPGCRRIVPPQETSVPAAPARPLIEFQSPHYDGKALAGRLLVGSEEGTLTLDRRLIENSSVEVVAVLDCATAQPVEFLVADRFPPPAREEDLLRLEPGYWFGTQVDFPLFDEQLNGKPGPDCIEITLSFIPKPPTPALTTTLRVSQIPAPPDAGQGPH
ncbi:hypothetical protein OV208_39545 [Corallococcus sp. bb12-1]|uniref:hypothetical protein n=1 Tax=Corallococcus sp. bb12-1 TaxID=2996784 RepID=UPI002271CC3B|nr:hypothetical protein [Corallococcus sp. bb12-1]MCY1047460.1 hypothetical protein [Corallococcus sp. bb12-1]